MRIGFHDGKVGRYVNVCRGHNAHRRRRHCRRGYALLLVMVFAVLFGAVLSVAWRRVGSALRIEHISEIRKQCDRGSIQTLAEAMEVLKTRLRRNSDTGVAELDVSETSTPDYRTGYSCKSRIQYDVSDDPDHPDLRWYIIVFAYESTDAEGAERWSINVTSTKDDPGLPLLPISPP